METIVDLRMKFNFQLGASGKDFYVHSNYVLQSTFSLDCCPSPLFVGHDHLYYWSLCVQMVIYAYQNTCLPTMYVKVRTLQIVVLLLYLYPHLVLYSPKETTQYLPNSKKKYLQCSISQEKRIWILRLFLISLPHYLFASEKENSKKWLPQDLKLGSKLQFFSGAFFL